MILQLPPAPPPASLVAPSPEASRAGDLLLASECAKNSRDCFPEDRVGVGPVTVQEIAPAPGIDPRALSSLFQLMEASAEPALT